MNNKDCYYIYILSNKKQGTLYIGFTDNIQRRIYEHKNKKFKGFTSKYSLNKLVYYETILDLNEAKLRERRLKKWNRKWKIELIERINPEWNDLSVDFSRIINNEEKIELLFGKKNNFDNIL